MMKYNLQIAVTLAVVSLLFLLSPAFADNSMIPYSLFSVRDTLLGRRQDLLAQRSEATARLTAVESAKRQCDVLLAGNLSKDDHDRLIGLRGACTANIDDLKAWLESVQRALLAVDDGLRECEARMNWWACRK